MQKKLIFSILFYTMICSSQVQENPEIKSLEIQKSELKDKIGLLTDSLVILTQRINTIRDSILATRFGTNSLKIYTKTIMVPRIRETVDPNSKILIDLYKDIEVELLAFENNYWLVHVDSIYGYVYNNYLIQTDTMKQISKYYSELRNEEKKRQATEEREKRLKEHEEWLKIEEDSRTRLQEAEAKRRVEENKYRRGTINIGMSYQDAIKNLGYPIKRNKSVGEWGIHEQWVYGSGELYLYFDNGILTSYQKDF